MTDTDEKDNIFDIYYKLKAPCALQSIKIIYSKTHEESKLRKYLAIQMAWMLIAEEQEIRKKEWRDEHNRVFEEVPDFALDVLKFQLKYGSVCISRCFYLVGRGGER